MATLCQARTRCFSPSISFNLLTAQRGGPPGASHHWREWRLTAVEQLAQGYGGGKDIVEICEFSIEITVWEMLEEFVGE